MADIEIEAFRANTPASKGITAADLQATVAAFNPDMHRAPVVMGHPGNDQEAPSFGVLSGARVEGNSLYVKIKNLAQEAVDGVKGSRILNRSIAFWDRNHPSNPNPGTLSLRHLGLLGGAAPAIPNMAPLRFAADDGDVPGHIVAEGEPGAPMIYAAADAAPQIDVAELALQVAAIIKPAEVPAPTPEQKEFAVATEAELAERERIIAEREAAATAKENQFAADEANRLAAEKTQREADNTTFAAGLVTAGRFPAGHQQDLVSILNALPTETLTFSGDVKEAPAVALKRILGAAAPVIKFEQVSPTGEPIFSAQDDDEAKALAASNERSATAWRK